MTAITDTRKRSRDEDNCDFMPISKRINNLSITNPQHNGISSHIPNINYEVNHNAALNDNGTEMQHNHQGQASYFNGNHLQNGNHYQHDNHQETNSSSNSENVALNNNSHLGLISNGRQSSILEHQSHQQHHHHQQHEHDSNEMLLENYSPELTADENPFYFNKNKLLFDLHIERERRNQSNH